MSDENAFHSCLDDLPCDVHYSSFASLSGYDAPAAGSRSIVRINLDQVVDQLGSQTGRCILGGSL